MNIIGYIISGPSGEYDTAAMFTKDEARSIVRAENRALEEQGEYGGYVYGVVYEDGSVSFEV